jgi:hypothetical protein
MIAHTEEHLDLCAGHALGNLDESERRRLADHRAAGCPQCDVALGGFTAAALVVARGAPLSPPPAALRAKVLSDARLATAGAAERARTVTRASGPGVGMSPGGWIAVCLCVAIAAVAAWFQFEIQRLKREGAELEQRLARVSTEMVEAAGWEIAVAGPAAVAVMLDPVQAGGVPLRGAAFYDAGTRRAVIVASGEGAVPGGRLVAWAIEGGAPVALGVLAPGRLGRAVLRAERPAGAPPLRGFAISREPAGESLPPRPGELLAQGSVPE